MSDEHDVATIKAKKYSFLTVVKLIIFAWVITWVMNSGSYLTVFLNHAMAKGIGIADDAIAFCHNCGSWIGL